MKLKHRRGVLIGAAAALALVIVVALLSGASDFGLWQSLGKAAGTRQDLGPVDFATLTRRATPDDSLACLPDICPAAHADVGPLLYTISATRLRDKLRNALRDEPRLAELAAVDDLHLRYVQRSPVLGIPDVIDVLVVPRSTGAATLAIYSRSATAHLDASENRDRVERWLSYIGL